VNVAKTPYSRESTFREEYLLEERGRAGISVILVYPNSYSVGMGNLGFQKVYSLINSLENAYCERAFLPSPEEAALLEKRGSPLLSRETRTRLSRFDIVAFSLTFEMDYLNCLRLLHLAHIPLKHSDRGDRDPLVLGGGIATSANPEPLADFIDCFAIGEAEETLSEFFQVFDRHLPRQELLKKLAGISGVYSPSGYEVRYGPGGAFIKARQGFPEKVCRRWVKELDAFPTASVFSAPMAVFGDMRLIEINRGCGRHCRFCLAGYLYRPPRFYSFKTLKKEIDAGLESGKRIGLVGSACCDHPDILRIARYITEHGGEFSVSSLRLERIPEGLLQLLAHGGLKTLAVAPEAGTERLRAVVNKSLDHEALVRAAGKIFASGIPNLKLYFLIGLPTEQEEDITGIVSLAWELSALLADRSPKTRGRGLLTISVNPFIPKPVTPFERVGMESERGLKEKLKNIKKGLRGLKNVRLIHEKPKYALIQAALSRGDRRMGEVLLRALALKDQWPRAFQEDAGTLDFYVRRAIPAEEPLAWDMIDSGIEQKYLITELQKSSSGRQTPPCPATPCYRCGDFGGM